MVSELIVGRRDAKLPAHPDECAREHIDLGVASGVQVLQGRIAGRWLDGTALLGQTLTAPAPRTATFLMSMIFYLTELFQPLS